MDAALLACICTSRTLFLPRLAALGFPCAVACASCNMRCAHSLHINFLSSGSGDSSAQTGPEPEDLPYLFLSLDLVAVFHIGSFNVRGPNLRKERLSPYS